MTDTTARDADLRPVDPATGKPLGPMETPGYYPRYHTLDQQKFWDAKTREVILDRVNNVPPIRFFTPEQARLLEAVCARVLPQDDRDDAHKIPIVPQIDKRLYEDKGDGYRYEDMPPDREAFILGLQAIEQMAQERFGRGFLDLRTRAQEELLKALHDAEPWGAHDIWERMPVHRFFMLLVKDCAENYYAHPYAWDEIGFGGPAYPRAYMRLERGQPEPWEVHERRYEWEPPNASLSGEYESVAGQEEQYGSPGQGGTH
ncbi:MAG: gluconate 2-dehydrogenase subunit 3 family protein [Candidatus Eremiobacteraeota bacterium]|nr:gluconate 2-dehydrogenase subunit 3 family protein [Candidatus Eremiobacteraeota bacterium]MBC5801789.1 gluconate 2-dehydrogenase subunit 3 family protein [Candidatus Eremiobacteraeota bacterium]MBC5823145.1 gluconate 2-dehydrogenase subunit 3 family protein [Candidatus Eremiobacteraeota bacterium]